MKSLLLAALLAGGARAQDHQRPPHSPEDLAQVRQVTEVRVSPDGETLAFITDITGALEVWTVPSEGGWPTQVSFLGEQASGLRYSSDGKTLAFSSDFGGDERPDLYLVPAAGGKVENVTHSTRAETSPRFSPDSKRLAFLADPGRPFLFQLMVLDLETRIERQLTAENETLHNPVWSRDGRLIAVTRSGDDQKGSLLLVDADSATVRIIAAPVEGGILYPEQFGDQGVSLLARATNPKGFLQLYLIDLKSGRGEFVGPETWDVEHALMHPKAGMIFTRNEGGASGLYRMTGRSKGQVMLAPRGRIDAIDLDDSGGTLAYLWSDSARPPDAWILRPGKGEPRRVTESLLGGIKNEDLSPGKIIAYDSFDRRRVHAILIRPRVHRLGSPPPLIVDVHGGPDWQSFDDFHPLRQALAEAGFVVVAPNYRGSSGFGREFLDLNNRDWGGGDLRDILWVVRRLQEGGEIDPARAAIMGGSYGGYMTLTALTKSADVWSAGVEAYGMPDLVQDYELSKDRFADWYETEMGNPKANAALFRDRSSIHFLDRVTAPLLIFQGANDTNVPEAESRLVYDALKKRGMPAELVVYPDEGHGFTKRKNRVDYYKKTVEFFIRHLSLKEPQAKPAGE